MSGDLVAGRYRVLRPLGRGGMGEVVLARHETLQRDVALKRMRSDVAVSEQARARMLREARAMGALRHENIVEVLDAGEEASGLYIAMEIVDGDTLRSGMARGMSVASALDVVRQVADGLAAAHHAGIVHRDLKPENVMVTTTGRAKILDFGLARGSEGGETVTEQGILVGTPGYIAPEVAQHGDVGSASDVYALGVIAYELTTGRAPFTAPSAMSLVLKHIAEPVPAPGVSAGVDALVLACLDKDPAKRPAASEVSARCRALVAEGGRATEAMVSPAAPPTEPSLAIAAAPLVTRTTASLQTQASTPPVAPSAASSPAKVYAVAAVAIVALVVVAFIAHDLLTRGLPNGVAVEREASATASPSPASPAPATSPAAATPAPAPTTSPAPTTPAPAPAPPRAPAPPAPARVPSPVAPPTPATRERSPFPNWALARPKPNGSPGAAFGPAQWLATGKQGTVLVVLREGTPGGGQWLDTLERLAKHHQDVNFVLAFVGDTAKTVVPGEVMARAPGSSVAIVIGMRSGIRMPDSLSLFAAAIDDEGSIAVVEEGVAVATSLERLVQSARGP